MHIKIIPGFTYPEEIVGGEKEEHFTVLSYDTDVVGGANTKEEALHCFMLCVHSNLLSRSCILAEESDEFTVNLSRPELTLLQEMKAAEYHLLQVSKLINSSGKHQHIHNLYLALDHVQDMIDNEKENLSK